MELSPIGGAEIAERLKRLYALPPPLIARYNALLAKTEHLIIQRKSSCPGLTRASTDYSSRS
jgi:hypothetical protein